MANNWILSVYFLAGSLIAASSALAQSRPAAPAPVPEIVQVQPGPAAPVPPLATPTAPPVAAAVAPAPMVQTPSLPGGPITPPISLTINLEPGGGMLLQLPRPAATIIVADPRVARVTPASATSLFLVGVAPGRTNMIVTDEAGLPTIQYDVTVRRLGGQDIGGAPGGPSIAPTPPPRGSSVAHIENMLRQNVPGASGVKISLVDGALIMSGTIGTPAQAQQLDAVVRSLAGGDRSTIINRVEVMSSMQVNVKVRIAEMARTVGRDLGFNWRAMGQSGGMVFSYLTPGALAGSAVEAMGNLSSHSTGLGLTRGNWDIAGVLDALATNALVSILAEPNLTTMSGEAASFLAGGEFPIPVASGGNNAPGVEFKQYGVSLAVVPTVLSPTKINMRIRPEVSEPDARFGFVLNNQPVFGVTTRRAETTVELGSGQSFAIAGLLSNKITDNLSAMPWLGELPVLGALFKSVKFSRDETELVIIVTPYLVRPVEAAARMRAPNDNFRPATDLDRLLYGRQMRRGDRGPAGNAVDAGFILK